MGRKSWDKRIAEYNERKAQEKREQDRNNNMKEMHPDVPDNH